MGSIFLCDYVHKEKQTRKGFFSDTIRQRGFMNNSTPRINFRALYAQFDLPVTNIDCGQRCSPHNPRGIPFCCDICEAVPVAYLEEWKFLEENTALWHVWRGDECLDDSGDLTELRNQIPGHMMLLACNGPKACLRQFRSLSCRQFPFFPYITADNRILGLAYHWDFEATCWVISNLAKVTNVFRGEFIRVYDELLAQWDDDFESYADLSEDMREQFGAWRRRIPLLHRDGGYYLLSPRNEKLSKIAVEDLPRFGPYR
jgi:hypothetical protein